MVNADRLYTLTLPQLATLIGRVRAKLHDDELVTRRRYANHMLILEDGVPELLERELAELDGPRFGHMRLGVFDGDDSLDVVAVYNPEQVRPVLTWARRLVRNGMIRRVGKGPSDERA